MGESPRRSPLTELNRLIKDNRLAEYPSPNLVLGMRPVVFASGTSRWLWEQQPSNVLNPFGTVQGGYLAVLIDEMFSTAIASVLEVEEWAMTAEFKINFLRALNPSSWLFGARATAGFLAVHPAERLAITVAWALGAVDGLQK